MILATCVILVPPLKYDYEDFESRKNKLHHYYDDFINQNRIIIGGKESASKILEKIYSRAFPNVIIIKTTSDISEMII